MEDIDQIAKYEIAVERRIEKAYKRDGRIASMDVRKVASAELVKRFGWRSGRYFIENAMTWDRFESAQAQGM